MSSESGTRQPSLWYAGGIVITLYLIAGCSDAVPESPNPPRPAIAGGHDRDDPNSLLKPRTPVTNTHPQEMTANGTADALDVAQESLGV